MGSEARPVHVRHRLFQPPPNCTLCRTQLRLTEEFVVFPGEYVSKIAKSLLSTEVGESVRNNPSKTKVREGREGAPGTGQRFP